MYKRAPRRRRYIKRQQRRITSIKKNQRGGIAFLPVAAIIAKTLGPAVGGFVLKKIANKILK